MARVAIRRASSSGTVLHYHLFVRNDNRRPRRVTLKIVTGPGDTAEPVMTIMLPGED
jgi:hypothetical protein